MSGQETKTEIMEFTATMAGHFAHHFNNFLTPVLGYADLATKQLPADHPVQKKLTEIIAAGNRCSELVSKLLSISAKRFMVGHPLSLPTFLKGVFPTSLSGNQIEIRLVIDPTNGDRFCVSSELFQLRVLVEALVDNAADAIRARGGTGVITIEVGEGRVAEEGSWVLLKISDDGCGMDAETLQHAFEPFFTTRSKLKRLGLGLSQVWGIVQQHGGKVELVSEVGVGTTVKVFLPRYAQPAASETTKPTPTTRPAIILLVDDERSNVNLLTELLSEAGYTVLSNCDPREALRIGSEHPGGVDLLVTDILMPQMNGKQLSDALRQQYPELRVLYISGYAADIFTPDEMKTHTFLEKPFDIQVLLKTVSTLLSA